MDKAKFWFWILINALLVVVIVALVGAGVPFLARYGNSLASARTVTVTAEGKTTATPDLADLSFSVVTQGADPNGLASKNNDKMNSVMQFLESQGVASSDIKTTSYDLQPNYQYGESVPVQGVINGYTFTQTVDVKVRDITKVASILGGLPTLGVNQIGGINFMFADDNAVLAVARADAMKKAQEKAQQMASGTGVSLGEVVSVSENSMIPGPRPVYLPASASMGMGNAAKFSSPVIQPGSEDVTDDVTITYALR